VVRPLRPWRRVVLDPLAPSAVHSPPSVAATISLASATPSAQSRCVRVTPRIGELCRQKCALRQNAGDKTPLARRQNTCAESFARKSRRINAILPRPAAQLTQKGHYVAENALLRQNPGDKNCSGQTPLTTCRTKDGRKTCQGQPARTTHTSQRLPRRRDCRCPGERASQFRKSSFGRCHRKTMHSSRPYEPTRIGCRDRRCR
jgi:hypothetical protein